MSKTKVFPVVISASLIFLASFFILRLKDFKDAEQFVIVPQRESASNPTPSPSPIPEEYEQISPDGRVSLKLKKKPGRTQSDYLFSIINHETETEEILYSTKRSMHRDLSIPFNTWSPDNQYIFWEEKTDGKNYYYVMSASTDEVMEPIDVVGIFDANDGEYKIDEITGWAAPGLLIANTRTADGSHGPSFWFEVYSENFIQLSTGFY